MCDDLTCKELGCLGFLSATRLLHAPNMLLLLPAAPTLVWPVPSPPCLNAQVQGFARVPALSISPSTGPGTGCGLQLPRVGRDGKTSDSSRRTLADLLKPSANEAAQLTGLLSKAGISVPTPANLDSAEPSSYKHAGHGHKRMVNPHGHAHHHGSGFVDPLFNLTET